MKVSYGVAGTLGRLTFFHTATKSYWIATTKKHITSKRFGKEERGNSPIP